ncbi:MAG: malonyl-CoA decarboxylase, partial [Gammaproteobacteria bacterium]|nr:malonyl-CoA decarboxylase [Gammaproteobacteria bacterium]
PGEERAEFFASLAENYDASHEAISAAAENYAAHPSIDNFIALEQATQTPRRKLLRRINLAPGGTAALVAMREHLLPLLRENSELQRVDHDFLHLFKSWFNRGFLVLRQIDWSTPANILEKIIAYEAVHEIQDWDELRRRLLPEDRRCFAFFHPSMPDDPLIFVEVALTGDIPGSIQALLAEDRDPLQADEATTAVFYSISNCQQGLAGVSFGSFLIKRVAEKLSREIPNLKTFVTLSPIPGFGKWLRQKADSETDNEAATALRNLRQADWPNDEASRKETSALLKPLAVEYFVAVKNRQRQPVDPVARFHLGNGAILHKIHSFADISVKGLEQSAGMMVNYLYNLADIEANHEAYADHGAISVSKEVRNIAPGVFVRKK